MKKKYNPVIAKTHTEPYKIHRYFARRPWNVFFNLINKFSKKKQIILDPFCGGGTTIYEAAKLGRKVIGLDINPLSIFITRNMFCYDDLNELDKIFSKIDNYLAYLYSDLLQNVKKLTKNKVKDVDWIEAAHQVQCSNCNKNVVLLKKNQDGIGKYKCVCKKNFTFKPLDCKRNSFKYLNIKSKNKKLIFNKKISKIFNNHNNILINKINKEKIKIKKNLIPLKWDRQHEDALKKKNIFYFEDFFTKRNLYINILLKSFIQNLKISKRRKELFRFVLSSSLRDTNIMTFSSSNWQSGKPASWSKHAYWVPPQFCEVNVRHAFKLAYQRIRKCNKFNRESNIKVNFAKNFRNLKKNNVLLLNNSISKIKYPNNFVDIIITDPPYGHNVQYLELSHFWYNWNKDLYPNKRINFRDEAISNRKKFKWSKNVNDYEKNLCEVFKHSYKILKPDGLLIMTFNNKNFSICLALLISVFKSGFCWRKDAIYFQDGILNYKHTAHTKAAGSPYGDFIYIFEKRMKKKMHIRKKISPENLIFNIKKIISNYSVAKKNKEKDIEYQKIAIFKKVIPVIQNYYLNRDAKDINNIYNYFKEDFLQNLYEKKTESKKINN